MFISKTHVILDIQFLIRDTPDIEKAINIIINSFSKNGKMKLKNSWCKTLARKLTGNWLAELLINGWRGFRTALLKPANRFIEVVQSIILKISPLSGSSANTFSLVRRKPTYHSILLIK